MIPGLIMDESSDPRGDAVACDFLAMVERDRATGTVRSLAAYQARFPGHEDRIAREWAAGVPGDAPAENKAPARTLGRYHLVRELGRGGQAVVYLAHDPELDRTVAMKVLVSEPGWLSQARRERLQREATALARLDHPGICAIYEARLEGDTPYLVVRYVAGETLAARLRRARERPDARAPGLLLALPDTPARIERLLLLIETVARALHAAHAAGVVHRDVKPQNVMLDAEDRPVLLDFGLAHAGDDATLELTRSGELFGSIAYLAPERLRHGAAGDARGDVYSLGAVLYECLTLERPHAATTTEALLREISLGAWRDPLRFNRALPRDLVLVLHAAMDPDPERRYPSALAFAEDLRRLREHQPILARPIGPWLRLRRWVHRHPAMAATLLLLLVALSVTTTLLVQMAAQNRRMVAWQRVLESLSLDEPTTALGNVLAAAPYVPERKLNGPLLQLLGRSPAVLEFDAERLGGGSSDGITLTPDGNALVIPTVQGEIVLADARSGEVLRRVPAHAPALMFLATDAARRTWVTSSLDGKVRLWDAASATPRALPAAIAEANRSIAEDPRAPVRLPRVPLVAPAGGAFALFGPDDQLTLVHLRDGSTWRRTRPGHAVVQAAFQPSGDLLAVRWRNVNEEYGATTVDVFSVEDGTARTLDLGGQETFWLAWDDAGQRLAVVGIDGVARVLEAKGFTCLQRLQADGEDYRHLHWVSFQGDRLVTTGFEGLTVWDIARGTRVVRRTSPSLRPFYVGAWNRDQSELAVVVKDGTVRIYDGRTFEETGATTWHYRFPNGLLWNDAGDRLVFQDGRTLRVVAHQAPAPMLPVHEDMVVGVEFLADGSLLTASRDGTAMIVDRDRGRPRLVMRHADRVSSAHASADGTTVVTACADGAARLWPTAGGEPPRVLPGHDGAMTEAVFFDRDTRVLSVGADGNACIFDVGSASLVRRLVPHEGAVLCLAVAPELGLLATGAADRTVHVYDWDGELVRTLDTFPEHRTPVFHVEGNASAMVFDVARRRLLVANRCDVFMVFDVDDWHATRIRPEHEGQAFSLQAAFVPGAAYYATAHSGVGDWTFVDVATLRPGDLGKANMHDAIVSVMRFAPDGRLLLVGSRDGRTSLWDLQARELHVELNDDHGGVRCAAFSSDGEWIAAGHQDGAVHVWPVHPLQFARAHHARLTGR